ncbi:hypothetical protein DFH07DRAFT_771432 [Mycena maculata]|uniref:Uncharacterized protein n=1 Tax=Mycena maculata TaxID=230809 RepID=A0AAD7JEB5_9AGAR|nr:hypothetical protein DFH07DRAFT_771432 [Mycena maculata]
MQWEIDFMAERDKKDGRYNYQLLEDGINFVGMREDHGTQKTLAGFRFFRFFIGPQTLEQRADVQRAHTSRRSTRCGIGTSEGDAGLVGSLNDHIGGVLVFDFHTIWGEAVVRARCVHIAVEVNGKREGKV